MITFFLLVSAFFFQFTVMLSKFRHEDLRIEKARKEMVEIEGRIDEKLDNMKMVFQVINEQYNGGNTVVKDDGHVDASYNGCKIDSKEGSKRKFADAEDAVFEEVSNESETAKEDPGDVKRPDARPTRMGCPKMSSAISTAEAMKYWRKLRAAGFVDDDFRMLNCSRQQAMYIALSMSEKIRLKNKWKPFEDFWGIRKLAQEKCKMEKTGILPPRAKEIIEIFK